jgi:hypothetical protein
MKLVGLESGGSELTCLAPLKRWMPEDTMRASETAKVAMMRIAKIDLFMMILRLTFSPIAIFS